MQIPIQQIRKSFLRLFPYIVILILVFSLFFQRDNFNSELKDIEIRKTEVLKQNEELKKSNLQLTNFIENSLSERKEVIEKHYYTKEVINNKTIQYEKDLSNVTYNDSIGKYITEYRYKPIGSTAD